jgi:hypothetical protein
MIQINEFKLKQLKWKIQNIESAKVKAELDVEEYSMNQQGKIREYEKQLKELKEELKNKDGK